MIQVVPVEKDKSTAVQNRSRSISFASSNWKNSKINYIDLKFIVRPGARYGALSDSRGPTDLTGTWAKFSSCRHDVSGLIGAASWKAFKKLKPHRTAYVGSHIRARLHWPADSRARSHIKILLETHKEIIKKYSRWFGVISGWVYASLRKIAVPIL